MRDGVLMHVQEVSRGKRKRVIEQVYLPRAMRQAVLKECHDGHVAGHLGIDRTYRECKTECIGGECMQM